MSLLDKKALIDAAAESKRKLEAAKGARLGLPFPYVIIPPDWEWLEPPANPSKLAVAGGS